jgi:hypothetical protein
MKRNLFSQLFALVLFCTVAACQSPGGELTESPEDALSSGQWLSFHEVQCGGNPWGYCNKTPDTRVCVQEYVENQGYTVLNVTATQPTQGAICMACSCLTGRVFHVKVAPADLSKLLAVGFKKQ